MYNNFKRDVARLVHVGAAVQLFAPPRPPDVVARLGQLKRGEVGGGEGGQAMRQREHPQAREGHKEGGHGAGGEKQGGCSL